MIPLKQKWLNVIDLIKEFPNDKELGKEIRNYYNSLKG
jgi:hypothetical protein